MNAAWKRREPPKPPPIPASDDPAMEPTVGMDEVRLSLAMIKDWDKGLKEMPKELVAQPKAAEPETKPRDRMFS